jgi:EAL domain-containing protein (putative c-di-GMP-specific phosphodiesterase class I)
MAALKETGLPATRLELEITESILIEDTATTFAIVEELRSHQISVALDDFGTGFSSLSYLNDFKFSTVKIDRKFTQTVDQSPRTAAIIGAIAKITRDLKIELVAEGVETESQLAHLCSFGIHAIQGYLFSRPVPAHKLATLIKLPIRPAVTLRSTKPRAEKAAGKGIRNVG